MSEQESRGSGSSELRGAIARALAFFDVFGRPLTALETWRYLPVKASIREVVQAMGAQNGYHCLAGGQASFARHQAEHRVAVEKWAVALKAARILRFVWGVRLAAVCNNFNYKKESDIDLFIVAAGRRIWLVRALSALALHLFRLRRHGRLVRDRVCLSFYVSEDGLDLARAKLPDDPYFDHWLARLFPVYDAGGAYARLAAANPWLSSAFPNWTAQARVSRRFVPDNWLSRAAKLHQGLLFSGRTGDWLERLARAFQLKKMARNAASAARFHDTRVVISDTMLKFHENDRREFYRSLYREKLKTVNTRFDVNRYS